MSARRVLFAALVGAGVLAAAQEPARGAIEVQVTDLRAGGVVWVSLYDEPKGFPASKPHGPSRQDAIPDGGVVQVRFEGLPEHDYAVAVIHDENGDGVLATGIFKIPKEGVGVSRDSRPMFGPPRFNDAVVHLDAGAVLPLTVHMRY